MIGVRQAAANGDESVAGRWGSQLSWLHAAEDYDRRTVVCGLLGFAKVSRRSARQLRNSLSPVTTPTGENHESISLGSHRLCARFLLLHPAGTGPTAD
jgi:hypothetical protein